MNSTITLSKICKGNRVSWLLVYDGFWYILYREKRVRREQRCVLVIYQCGQHKYNYHIGCLRNCLTSYWGIWEVFSRCRMHSDLWRSQVVFCPLRIVRIATFPLVDRRLRSNWMEAVGLWRLLLKMDKKCNAVKSRWFHREQTHTAFLKKNWTTSSEISPMIKNLWLENISEEKRGKGRSLSDNTFYICNLI